MKKRLFQYASDLVENFELKKNGTKNHVPIVVVDAIAIQNMACESKTKKFAKTPKEEEQDRH